MIPKSNGIIAAAVAVYINTSGVAQESLPSWLMLCYQMMKVPLKSFDSFMCYLPLLQEL
jgi:hypothetical protein